MEATVKDVIPGVVSAIASDDEILRGLRSLADLRAESSTHDAMLASARQRFEEEHSALLGSAVKCRADMKEQEEAVRAYAVSRYQSDPSIGKHPWTGVEVTVGTEIDYPADEALTWAIEHKQCLALDNKDFYKLCKIDSLRPGFVTEREKISVRIATDLAKALADDEPMDPDPPGQRGD